MPREVLRNQKWTQIVCNRICAYLRLSRKNPFYLFNYDVTRIGIKLTPPQLARESVSDIRIASWEASTKIAHVPSAFLFRGAWDNKLNPYPF